MRIPFKHPRPDAQYFVDFLMGRTRGGRVPLVEYLVDDVLMRPILTELVGRTWTPWTGNRAGQQAFLDNFIAFWYHMGYDFVRYETDLGFTTNNILIADTAPNSAKQRAWADQHVGAIMSWQDFDSYPWPRFEDVDFSAYEYINSHLPEGMGFIVSHGGGIYEHLSNMMSYEGLCLSLHDQPDLVQAMAERIGGLMVRFYQHLLTLDRVSVIFPGDDMGFRTGTLVAPKHLRQYSLVWHKRFAALAHQHGKPYFLHSCGNVEKIMPDLIEDVCIDGKHSYEDVIIPVEDFQTRYGDRIAVLGGMDIHRLTYGSEGEVRQRVRYLVETCGGRGRYAIGSGNSIPSYIPMPNYLAMIDEAVSMW